MDEYRGQSQHRLGQCSVEGCEKPSWQKGWCSVHYKRWYRHGDPLGGKTSRGAAEAFYERTVLAYEGDDCLRWPFSCGAGGRAQMWRGNKLHRVHRLVCEAVHGSPPTATHEAAHSCGNGHLGCVSPRHLFWKTRKQNEADKIAHGTRVRGEGIPWSKLTEDDVREITRLKGVVSQKKLADRFGVSAGAIQDIHSGKNWGWLTL